MKVQGIISCNEDTHNLSPHILCPPPPHLGGDLENNVYTSLAKVFSERTYVSLRFYYRGVGNSESNFETVLYREGT